MRRIYKLVRLRTETVDDLKELMGEMGIGSLDQLLRFMVYTRRKGRAVLANTGWTTEGGADGEHGKSGIVHS